MSYFSTQVGSIIGADRLSFRVRDGTGRFPVAVAAVTLLFYLTIQVVLVGGVVVRDRFVLGLGFVVAIVLVSFRPVSASSLHSLLSFQV